MNTKEKIYNTAKRLYLEKRTKQHQTFNCKRSGKPRIGNLLLQNERHHRKRHAQPELRYIVQTFIQLSARL